MNPRCAYRSRSGWFCRVRLCRRLAESGHSVVGAFRALNSRAEFPPLETEVRIIGDIAATPSWHEILPGVEVVIHLAALVHQMGTVLPSLDSYRHVNVTGTAHLADACVRHGVRQMVFLRSIKVNGECTPGSPYAEEDTPAPQDAYGISKLEAEQALSGLARSNRIETVVVRPPLVYGPGVRANFRRLLALVHKMNPVLVPQLSSKRSMIYLGNLVDFLALCSCHPLAADQLFLISDNEDAGVSDLMRQMAYTMKRNTLTIPAPESFLQFAAKILGKEQEIRRLTDPLNICPAKAMNRLGWSPPFDLKTGLKHTVESYMSSQSARHSHFG